MQIRVKKTVILLVFILLWLYTTVNFCVYLFHSEVRNFEENSCDRYFQQARIFSDLFSNASDDNDFQYWVDTASRLEKRDEIRYVYVVKNGENVLLGQNDSLNRIDLKPGAKDLKIKEYNLHYRLETQNNHNNLSLIIWSPIKPPLCFKENDILTLIIMNDTTLSEPLANQRELLKKRLFIWGVIIFITGCFLLLLCTHFISRQYLKKIKYLEHRASVNPFTLPVLGFNSFVFIKKSFNASSYWLSLEDKEILKIVLKSKISKTVATILKESTIDEITTYGIISGLVIRGIMEIKSQ